MTQEIAKGIIYDYLSNNPEPEPNSVIFKRGFLNCTFRFLESYENGRKPFNVGDICYKYNLSEEYRFTHPYTDFDKEKVKIDMVQLPDDPFFMESYAIINERGEYGAWYYPTFLEPI
jgi:hypothetical protein